MSRVQRRGFTLIELLTVIAIIAILAGLTMTVLPRMREKAKITKIKGTMANLNTALTNYFATNNSYPPAYGYRQPSSRGESPVPGQEDTYYFLKPYPTFIRYSLGDTEDIFSNGYSTDGNASLGILEFLPLGTKDVATNSVAFPMERFDGTNLAGEVSAQLEAEHRPLVYVPVNSRQFAIARKYWIRNNDFLAQSWNPADPDLVSVSFPPANYDAFVLISVGPNGNTGGVVSEGLGSSPFTDPDAYHLAALRTYFLATRDLNGNGELDFEFEARSQKFEAEQLYQVNGVSASNAELPNGDRLYGPLIYVSK